MRNEIRSTEHLLGATKARYIITQFIFFYIQGDFYFIETTNKLSFYICDLYVTSIFVKEFTNINWTVLDSRKANHCVVHI